MSENWIPDFSNRKLSVNVSPLTGDRINVLAIRNDMTEIDVARKLLNFGLLVARSEGVDATFAVMEKDNRDLTEHRIFLPLDDKGRRRLYKLGPITLSYTSICEFGVTIGGTRSGLKLSGQYVDEWMAVANRHHTNVDDVIDGALQLGTNAAEYSYHGVKSYIVRDTSGNEEKYPFFN